MVEMYGNEAPVTNNRFDGDSANLCSKRFQAGTVLTDQAFRYVCLNVPNCGLLENILDLFA